MKNLRYILAVAMLPLILCGCNQEDDIMEIFANGQTWHWSSSYTTSDWEDDNKGTSSLTQSEIRQINENADVYIINSLTTERWKERQLFLIHRKMERKRKKTRQFQSPLTRAALQADSTRLFMMKSRTPSSIGETLGSSNFSTQKETTSFNFIL